MGNPFPAGNQQGNLPQTQAIYYDSSFREGLHASTPFVKCAESLELPVKSGNTYKIFQYQPLSADTNQTAEGDPGSSETLNVIDTSFTIGEYGDYASISSYADLTAIDQAVDNFARELSYQLGESLSDLIMTAANGANSIDSSVQVQLAASSTTSFTALSLNVIRNEVQSMAGRSIKPFNRAKQLMTGVMHPFGLGDCIADNSNNGVLDLLKHTSEGYDRFEELGIGKVDDLVELPASGAEFYTSNLVTQTSNYKSVSGLTALRTYIFGQDGAFRVRLAGPNDTDFGDGKWENILCKIHKDVAPSVADPLGLVPSWAGYLVHFCGGTSPDPTQRIRTIDAASAVS